MYRVPPTVIPITTAAFVVVAGHEAPRPAPMIRTPCPSGRHSLRSYSPGRLPSSWRHTPTSGRQNLKTWATGMQDMKPALRFLRKEVGEAR
jgi:hypothetical protein